MYHLNEESNSEARLLVQVDEMGDIKKGPWKVEEDQVLINHVNKYGARDWSSIRSKGLLRRTGKSCRLRWVNKLRPNLKTGVKFSADEERTVIDLQAQFGNKWAKIATYLPGRTDNDVKNFWSSRQKRLARLLHTSTPSSSKSNKTTKQFPSPKAPNLHLPREEHNNAIEMVPFPSPFMYEKKEPHISFSFPQFPMEYPLLMEGQGLMGRLGGPSFVDGEFEHSSAQLPIFKDQYETEDIGSLIDDFLPMDLFDQIEQLPSPSQWS